jgi:hypothetical protein
MNALVVLLLGFFSSCSFVWADDANIWLPNIPAYATGTQVSGKNGLDVNIAGGSLPVTFPSGSPLPVVISSPNPLPVVISSPNPLPISAASLPLPSGAATSANQTNGTQQTEINNGVNVAAVKAASTAAVATDPALVIAVSPNNSVAITAASLPLPTGAATSANQATQITDLAAINTSIQATQVAQGSATSGQQGTVVLGAATTAAPTYSTTQTNPLSLNLAGGLRVDGSGVTQPVSGTVTTKAPVNANGSLVLVTTSVTEGSSAAPANTVGVFFQSDDANTVNMSWGVSNSATAILASGGLNLEPGARNYLPIGTGTFLHYIAASSTPTLKIQWILSQ